MKAGWRRETGRPRQLQLATSLVALGLVVVLGPTGASAQDPVLKDNGKIAFVSARTGDPEVYSREDRHGLPSYSPDGTKITFTASEDIWKMDADGSNQVRLSDHPAFDIQSNWQPIPRAAPEPPPELVPHGSPVVVSPCSGGPGTAGYLYPAKLRVSRARVLRGDRRLDVW